MEVDGIENLSNPSDGGKFSNLKAFATAAREFEATHSESAVNLMTRYLGVSTIQNKMFTVSVSHYTYNLKNCYSFIVTLLSISI